MRINAAPLGRGRDGGDSGGKTLFVGTDCKSALAYLYPRDRVCKSALSCVYPRHRVANPRERT